MPILNAVFDRAPVLSASADREQSRCRYDTKHNASLPLPLESRDQRTKRTQTEIEQQESIRAFQLAKPDANPEWHGASFSVRPPPRLCEVTIDCPVIRSSKAVTYLRSIECISQLRPRHLDSIASQLALIFIFNLSYLRASGRGPPVPS